MEIQFELIKDSDLEPYGLLNAIDYYIKNDLHPDAEQHIRVYLKYTAHDTQPYTESKITFMQLNEPHFMYNDYVFGGYVQIIHNEFKKYFK